MLVLLQDQQHDFGSTQGKSCHCSLAWNNSGIITNFKNYVQVVIYVKFEGEILLHKVPSWGLSHGLSTGRDAAFRLQTGRAVGGGRGGWRPS